MTHKNTVYRPLLLALSAGLLFTPAYGAEAAMAKKALKSSTASPAALQETVRPAAVTTATPKGPSLYDALAEAYLHNPDLLAARAELKSVDENYAQASAAFRPTVKGIADYTSSKTGNVHSDPKIASVVVTQSLYAGGASLANLDKAANQIRAARAKLAVSEQQVLLDAVTAYMSVLRDQELVELNVNNEKVLKSHLDAAEARFKLGDITKTDVSQAQSRYALATAQRIAAEGALKKSEAAFTRSIGLSALHLQKPAVKIFFPKTEEAALATALQRNPSIAFARYSQEQAKNNTRALEAGNLPSLDLTGSAGKVYDPSTSNADSENTSSIELRATLPLYEGGATTSRIRQSRQTENQLRLQMQSTDNNVREAVIQAREGLAAAEAECKSLQAQIEAEKLALEGVQVEANYGSRTTLDLLDAEQEYMSARVSYVGAETDRIIANYALLAALGQLTAQDLKLSVPVYDPIADLQNVK